MDDNNSLAVTDKVSAAVAVAPRISLAELEERISARYDFPLDKALEAMNCPVHPSAKLLSICVLVMRNGFSIVGKSAPASSANFNAEVGQRFAYEDAVRQVWPLEGYALRDRLSDADRP